MSTRSVSDEEILSQVEDYKISDVVIRNSVGKRLNIPIGVISELNIFENTIDGLHHATLHIGDLQSQSSVLTRVHPVQGFDDIIMNYNNPKTKDLHASIDKIKSHGSGIVVLINNPILGDLGQLSQDEKVKYYGLGAQILKNFSITNISVLSNSFSNELDLGIYGLNVSRVEKLLWTKKN